MRIALMVIGLVLLVGGVAAWFGKIQYPHEKQVMKVGSLSATVKEQDTVPRWAGGVAVLLGAGLIVIGFTGKR